MRHALPLAALLLLTACAPRQEAPPPADPPQGPGATADLPRDAFWDNLARHCGSAYPGRLVTAPPGDTMLSGTEDLVVHFRQCSADTLRLPFHIEREATADWDRSRTWIYTRTADGLELRHDHRQPDGSDDDVTGYGATTLEPGSANRQEFILTERTAPDGSPLGWRVEIEPGDRYTYGTTRGGEWTWRVDFDLSDPLAAPPPAPWGYEHTRPDPAR